MKRFLLWTNWQAANSTENGWGGLRFSRWPSSTDNQIGIGIGPQQIPKMAWKEFCVSDYDAVSLPGPRSYRRVLFTPSLCAVYTAAMTFCAYHRVKGDLIEPLKRSSVSRIKLSFKRGLRFCFSMPDTCKAQSLAMSGSRRAFAFVKDDGTLCRAFRQT